MTTLKSSDRRGRRRGRQYASAARTDTDTASARICHSSEGRPTHVGIRQQVFSGFCAILQFCGSACWLRVVTLATGCNKLGLGDNGSPTAPTGPPAAGLDDLLHRGRRQRRDRRRLERRMRALYRLPERHGLRARDGARAQGAGIHRHQPEPRDSDDGHRPGFPDPRRAVRTASSSATSSRQEMPFVQTNATVVTIFAGVNEINDDHGGARRRRGRERSERRTSTRR